MQKQAFEAHETPIVVVTIPSMAQYGWSAGIESFATVWFNSWKIGTAKNQGILLLVSLGDRKARIELGRAWGIEWDTHCRSVMETVIVPRFKEGQFPKGILDGVTALHEMARTGPQGQAPRAGTFQRVGEALTSDQPISPISPLAARVAVPLIGLGVLCLVLAIFLPEQRKYLLWAGIGLIVLALTFWLIVAVVGLWARRRGGAGSGSGGGSYGSSRGYGGGSSGGGGATGSW